VPRARSRSSIRNSMGMRSRVRVHPLDVPDGRDAKRMNPPRQKCPFSGSVGCGGAPDACYVPLMSARVTRSRAPLALRRGGMRKRRGDREWRRRRANGQLAADASVVTPAHPTRPADVVGDCRRKSSTRGEKHGRSPKPNVLQHHKHANRDGLLRRREAHEERHRDRCIATRRSTRHPGANLRAAALRRGRTERERRS